MVRGAVRGQPGRRVETLIAQVALSFTAEGEVRGISIGLRCPVDGALCLYIDDARVVPYAA